MNRLMKAEDATIKLKIYLNQVWWSIFAITKSEKEDCLIFNIQAPFKGKLAVTLKKEDLYQFKGIL